MSNDQRYMPCSSVDGRYVGIVDLETQRVSRYWSNHRVLRDLELPRVKERGFGACSLQHYNITAREWQLDGEPEALASKFDVMIRSSHA